LAPLADGGMLAIRATARGWEVLVWSPDVSGLPPGVVGTAADSSDGILLVGPAGGENARAIREVVPWLRPTLLGDGPSVGLGDRLGVATPGHVAALKRNPGIVPSLAQQSARELARTGRTFGAVLDAATFGALAAGWRGGFVADADHLKTLADVDAGVAAGFSMFTADPIEVVPDLAADAPEAAIRDAFEGVPWSSLEDDPGAFAARYAGRVDLGDRWITVSPTALRAAAARFGPAVVQIVMMYRHLEAARPRHDFVFEVAVDEIDYPTTPVDHVYLAIELRRLGVRWASLAPRFIGRFEKGIDYIGDPSRFEADVATHASIARALGPYKLSIHSGSDKFSIYEAAAAATAGAVHLKTSGTSYLVALATLARHEPDLMREIWRTALDAYSSARASYHVSASLTGVPLPDELPAAGMPDLLEDPGTREILHVTYGAVLALLGSSPPSAGAGLRDAIWADREAYWVALTGHIERHLRPFSPARTSAPAASH
jgi:hypothetical protein